MMWFVIALAGLFGIAVIWQLVTKMKIVGGNELGVVSGTVSSQGYRLLSGGRVFIIPLINRFTKLDLTPHTIEVVVDSAIAAGVVPLNVTATVSFAIASNEAGRKRAATRILSLAGKFEHLRKMANDIIEGHLRDSIASMTPEQVMQEKDTLVTKMINVCKSDLQNIGLEITTMNIADVDDHRLVGVNEPDLYIALLKRIQQANADMKAREAQANAKAASAEEQEKRRAEVQVRALENELESLIAETSVKTKTENQRRVIGIEEETRKAQAIVGGLVRQLEAEKQNIEMLKKKYEAEIVTPALAQKEKMGLDAQALASRSFSKAQADIDQLRVTLETIAKGGDSGRATFLIENFGGLIEPFAETLGYFPADHVSVITGAEGRHDPISAIHPNAVEREKNELIGAAVAEALGMNAVQKRTPSSPSPEDRVENGHNAELKPPESHGQSGMDPNIRRIPKK